MAVGRGRQDLKAGSREGGIGGQAGFGGGAEGMLVRGVVGIKVGR